MALYLKRRLAFTEHTKHFFIIGAFNSALPFLFFAYAAQTISASTLSILNSTTPIWGVVVGILWTKTKPNKSMVIGLLLGLIGVVILVGQNHFVLNNQSILAIVAALSASLCYVYSY